MEISMQKVILMLAMVLFYQTSKAQDIVIQKNEEQTFQGILSAKQLQQLLESKVVNTNNKIQVQKSKDAIVQLLQTQILVVNPEDNSIQLNLENNSTKSILEELRVKGLLNEEFAGRGPWCS